jgi:isopentenyl-diphosphate Delta-isomerase
MDDILARQHENRKAEHLALCVEQDVESDSVGTGFSDYRFIHEALPEIDLPDVDLRCEMFKRSLSAPFLISSMTGGCPESERINRTLSEAAQAMGIAMGVGSQRAGLIDRDLARTFQVRSIAPDITLLANIGAIQLNNGFTLDECRAAVEMIGADALVLHLNPLQESIQPGGDTNFSGLAAKIENVCRGLDVPVIVKEVGQGISERTARLLHNAGVAGIDTAGAGGTSWARVESLRGGNDKSAVGRTFSNWGIPTSDSIVMCRRAAPDLLIIGSGGIRSGLDAAKAMALGADIVGFGLPLLRDAFLGVEAVLGRLRQYTEELRTAMFCIGARTLGDLRRPGAMINYRQDRS